MAQIKRTAVPAMILWIAGAMNAEAGQTIFAFVSDPGDYIGAGETLVLTPDEVDFYASGNYQNGVSVSLNNFGRPDRDRYQWWYANFAAANSAELVVGTYENATRYPFNNFDGVPGLSVSGNGRGCNQLTGRFEIHEIVRDGVYGQVTAFAADYEQHCEGGEAALYGSIRINSDVPLPNLLPPRINIDKELNYQGCIEADNPDGTTATLTAAMISEGNYQFDWVASSGESGSGETFVLDVPLNDSTFVTVVATDLDSGEQADATREICASDTIAPVVTILNPIQGEIFNGNSSHVEIVVTDAVDQNIDEVQIMVGQRATAPSNQADGSWKLKVPLKKADPNGTLTDIEVLATDASNNTGQAAVSVIISNGSNEN